MDTSHTRRLSLLSLIILRRWSTGLHGLVQKNSAAISSATGRRRCCAGDARVCRPECNRCIWSRCVGNRGGSACGAVTSRPVMLRPLAKLTWWNSSTVGDNPAHAANSGWNFTVIRNHTVAHPHLKMQNGVSSKWA